MFPGGTNRSVGHRGGSGKPAGRLLSFSKPGSVGWLGGLVVDKAVDGAVLWDALVLMTYVAWRLVCIRQGRRMRSVALSCSGGII